MKYYSRLIFIFSTFMFGGVMCSDAVIQKKINHYQDLGIDLHGCEKQNLLWQEIVKTKYDELPELKKFGLIQLISMSHQELSLKTNLITDIAPPNWKKYLHRHGSVAKIKIVPINNSFTGIYSGADCGLLRLSLTYSPKGSKPVAPGLALKIFRENNPSVNVSALYSLEGQEKDFNFLKNPMSNIVPPSDGFGQKLVHKVFKRYSKYPEEVRTQELSKIKADGTKIPNAIGPRQIFFVPTKDLNFSSAEHDVREDFHNIPKGTVIYKIYARLNEDEKFDYTSLTADTQKQFLSEAIPIANIITTSEFISSEFGDGILFFRHQVHEKKNKNKGY